MKKNDISELVMDLEIDYYLKVQNQLLGPVSWLEIVHLYDLQTINENDFYSIFDVKFPNLSELVEYYRVNPIFIKENNLLYD